jgi:hypothetical protein
MGHRLKYEKQNYDIIRISVGKILHTLVGIGKKILDLTPEGI